MTVNYIYIFYIYIPEYICYYLLTLYGNVNKFVYKGQQLIKVPLSGLYIQV